MLLIFFWDEPDRAKVGDVGITGEDTDIGDVGATAWAEGVLLDVIGLEGIDWFLCF